MEKNYTILEKFRSNDCLFQLKIIGTLLRRGIPVLDKKPGTSLSNLRWFRIKCKMNETMNELENGFGGGKIWNLH